MNTRHLSRWFWPALAAVCLTAPGFADRAVTHSQGGTAKPNVATAGGLTVITFTANPGTITVNLPDDMRAGDTISGTVIAEPKGNTKAERGANETELKKFGIRLFGRAEDKPEDVVIGDVITVFKYALVNDRQTGNVIAMGLMTANGQTISRVTIPVLPMTPTGAVVTPDPKITQPTHPSGAVITPDPKITTPPGMTTSGAVITPDPKINPVFIIPPFGQAGRPMVITGPFDGNADNTKLTIGGQPQTPLAESPRQVVVQSPNNATGPAEVSVKEGGKETKGTFRNLKVDLTAPKTSLLKGESTELRVEVNGLEGLKQPVPLTLESHGVITMVGGNYQPLVIEPSQVGADGRYLTTRGITGVQTGGWTATATVVTQRFDFCLQDDSGPQGLILINSFSGDYFFPQPGGVNLVGSGTITRKDCVITLMDDRPDRRVQGIIDPCGHTGTASIQISPPNAPKVKFTIKDRNTTDNTCACGSGCR